jgi:c-di-AMP phosphodiesterase-like protein
MSRRYYTPPPTQGDIPAFLKRAYLANHMQNLIEWAKHEYNVGMNYLNKHASMRTILYFQQEVSAMRVLAESEEFREVLEYLNEDNYNKLSHRERAFIRRSFELFKALS